MDKICVKITNNEPKKVTGSTLPQPETMVMTNQCMAAGMNRFVSKPVDESELKAVLEKAVAEADSPVASRGPGGTPV